MEKELNHILEQIQFGNITPEDGFNKMQEIKQQFQSVKHDTSLLFMEKKWSRENADVLSSVPSDAFTIIFTDKEDNWIFAKDVVFVTRSGKFVKTSKQSYEINPKREEDYFSLVEQLKLKEKSSIRIIHLWSDKKWKPEVERIKEQLQGGIYSLFYLIRALNKVNGNIYLTYGYFSSEDEPQPQYAAISGFLKTVMQERRNIIAKKVELKDKSFEKGIKELWNESCVYGGNSEIICDKTQRIVKQMTECSPLEPKHEILIKKKETYIITGGLGGVGYIFASYFSKVWHANLVLSGRSKPKQEKIDILNELGGNVIYVQGDIADREQVFALVKETKNQFGSISGVIHSAGVVKDAYIQNKQMADIESVIAPKLYGTVWLDQALAEENLDFFVLFSAGAGITGNIGQCDYAYANCFLDEFSAIRNNKKKEERTLAINWPLWQDGGMQVSEEVRTHMTDKSGMIPLLSSSGIAAFEQALFMDKEQIIVAEGNCEKIKRVFKEKISTEKKQKKVQKTENILSLIQQELMQMISQILKIEEEAIDLEADLTEFGFDSIGFTKYSNLIHEIYGIEVMPSIFFDYLNLESLSKYLEEEFADEIKIYYSTEEHEEVTEVAFEEDGTEFTEEKIEQYIDDDEAIIDEVKQASDLEYGDKVAVIGMSCKMPKSDDTKAFWQHIVHGDDLIQEIPQDRWDWKAYYGDPVTEEDKTNIKWGGFMNDIRSFDAPFFQIPALEAELMDPQQRLFMQTVWHAIEDAGYKASDIAGTRTSLFVGVASIDYNQLMQSAKIGVQAHSATGVSHSVLANRLSYFLDIHGQSEPVDTACSSSLIAIHEAVDSIAHGDCEMAIAGGVNVIACPDVYISFSKAGMLSPTGSCKTFDNDADGYVRGEGCGAVLLKPLKKAIEDGNHIYGVLLGSAVNHGGHAATLTAPNPNAQAQVITEAWEKAGINPFTLSYIETHGTGTKLGDPVEIEGLKKAFAIEAKKQHRDMSEQEGLSIGTVKTQIGHLETAAGIASLIKVLLCFKQKKLVGNIHFNQLNSFISLKDAPFHILTGTKDWVRRKDDMGNEIKRRAAISGFGFGGANAHLVLEEYEDNRIVHREEEKTYLFLLSAKTKEALYHYVNQYISFLKTTEESFEDVIYTLWNGREQMKERIAILAESKGTAVTVLQDIFEGNKSIDEVVCYRNCGETGKERFETFLETGTKWLKGGKVDFAKVFDGEGGRRCSIPVYPFEKKQYWIPQPDNQKSFLAHSMYFNQVWKKDDKESYWERGKKAGKNLVIFSSPLFRTDEIADMAENIVTVGIQKSYEKISSYAYGINPLEEKDYVRLLHDLVKDNLSPDILVHGWLLDRTQEKEEVEKMFNFMKAVASIEEEQDRQILFFYKQDADVRRFDIRPISAVLRTVMQEKSNVQGKAIEICVNKTMQDVMKFVRQELEKLDEKDIEIRYQEKERYIRTLEKTSVKPKQNITTLKRRGVYVISGGMGGLGYLLAEHLVKTRQADIIITGRTPLTMEKQDKWNKLQQYGSKAEYYECDLTDSFSMKEFIQYVKKIYGKINGVFHCAGITNDGVLKDKTYQTFKKVIEPKTKGYSWMKLLAEQTNAEFFMCFSSVVGIYGNKGQADYAYANSFLNESVWKDYDNSECRLISVNWPLWEDGGMTPANEIINRNRQLGIYPLTTMEGMNIIEDILGSDGNEFIVIYGEEKVITIMHSMYASLEQDKNQKEGMEESVFSDEAKDSVLRDKTEEFLINLFAQMLHIRKSEMKGNVTFQEYGVDSLIVNQFNVNMSSYFGNLSKTLLFECSTVHDLADYLLNNKKKQLVDMLGLDVAEKMERPSHVMKVQDVVQIKDKKQQKEAIRQVQVKDIAIIGMSGRYPEAENLNIFWDNLKSGKDSIVEVPKNRWDIDKYYNPDPNKATEGKMYCRMGGFIQNESQFDPLFFNISKREAELIDPQERIFIETAWAAFEDAGYSRERIQKEYKKYGKNNVGVYVGMTTHTYALWGPEECQKGNIITPNLATWSVANRISYLMNLNGPSMTVDTACSSSLTALHLACESIYRGESQVALVGGVNLYLHPSKYVTLSIARMLSPTGKCHSFGKDSDGFVPGEGVGALLIKSLEKAKEDGDHIYAVIKSTAVNHGGATNGFTVPSPNMQAQLMKEVMKRSNIKPETVSYIEAHGTGTTLGDPIEITGLTKAFNLGEIEEPFCSVGSVKSNIGHLEACAGIASITKVVLQMQHKMLVPSLHSEELNPNLTLDKTPFYIQQELEPWKASGDKRRAGVSGFGAGGANAHVILEEYVEQESTADEELLNENIFVLSAKNKDRLTDYVQEMLEFLDKDLAHSDIETINRIAYTLQIGRGAMEERMAMVVSNIEDLKQKLQLYLEDAKQEDIYSGNTRNTTKRLEILIQGEEGKHFLSELIGKKKLDKVAQLWVEGINIDWMQLYRSQKPCTISLPTYPFKHESFFVTRTVNEQAQIIMEKTGEVTGRIDAMITDNCSTFRKQHYVNRVDGTEFYLRDHVLGNDKILPGVCYLEMAREAGSAAAETTVTKLCNVIWAKPVVMQESPLDIHIELKENRKGIGYEISTHSLHGEKIMHAQGTLEISENMKKQEEYIDIERIMGRCLEEVKGSELYEKFQKIEFNYATSFQGIQALYKGNGEAISRLHLPETVQDSLSTMVLQPSIMDGALQTVTGVMDERNSAYTAFLPFSLGELKIYNTLERDCFAYVKQADINQSNQYFKKFYILITDKNGKVLVKIKDLCVKAVTGNESQSNTSQEQSQIKFHKMDWTEKMISSNGIYHDNPILFLAKKEIKDGYLETCERNIYTVNFQTEEEWSRFFEAKLDAQIPEAVVWITEGEQASTIENILEEQINQQFIAVFQMCKALNAVWTKRRISKQVKVMNLIITDTQEYRPMQSALAGFGRTLTSENPKIWFEMLEVNQSSQGNQVEKLIDIAIQEATQTETKISEIRYVDGRRFVRELCEIKINEPPTSEVNIKENGVYLITGGAGGIGIIFAKHFAKNQKVKLALVGRRSNNKELEKEISKIEANGSQVLYLQADITKKEQVSHVIQKVKEAWNKIDGVIHCAGIVRDSYVSKKGADSFREVLGPKIKGMVWLDDLLKDEALDFFSVFSSTAAIIGNPGQSDYACGNYFMNLYGEDREYLRGKGLRSGKTIVYNWPLWKDGGMQVDKETLEWLKRKSGTMPLEEAEGIWAFEQIMKRGYLQPIISRYEDGSQFTKNKSLKETKKEVVEKEVSKDDLFRECEGDVKRLCSEILKVAEDEIHREEELINYGLDSIAMMSLVNKMEEVYEQTIDANILAEYTTIEVLSKHLVEDGIVKPKKNVQYKEMIGQEEFVEESTTEIGVNHIECDAIEPSASASDIFADEIQIRETQPEDEYLVSSSNQKIAVIGMACRFPQSEDIEKYWENLQSGKDMITEVPEDRWDIEKYFSTNKQEEGKAYSKWGGFTNGIYDFAADYFKVSDIDALIMDPHHRVMLELTDELFYRSGYEPIEFSGTKTSVFIGGGESDYVKNNMGKIPNEYMKHGLINNIPNMMAARISDFYNLKGSSKTIDSACSSSLVALHDACQAIRMGECEMAICGGVELLVDAQIHIAFSKAEVLSNDGRCKVFDQSADGMVPGEGAGMVLLKPYEKAVQDGDNILGVILGSAVNNDGHTMGLTVPGIEGQKDVIMQAIRRSGISPRSIQYLEAHGTGTLLGDPIEIRAAEQVYEKYTQDKQFCAVASVKSNMGHLMRAAGIASFIKVILSLENKWIPSTLHCSMPHPRFRFNESPFFPAVGGKKWISEGVRRAAISSFGFGGTNCHMIVEEYTDSQSGSIRRIPLNVPHHEKRHFDFAKWLEREKEQLDKELLDILDDIESGKLKLKEAEKLIQLSK